MRRESQVTCQALDDETVELFVMGRLHNEPLKYHLKACDFCRERAVEHRSWIEDLKRGLLDFKQADVLYQSDEDADHESNPDGS